MSITNKIEKFHKNRIKSIMQINNSIENDLTIGAFVADLGNRAINGVSKALHMFREKIKSCYDKLKNVIQLKLEFKGRKNVVSKYPNIKKDIETIVEKYKNVDPHFKTELLYISINPNSIINELVLNYSYSQKICLL